MCISLTSWIPRHVNRILPQVAHVLPIPRRYQAMDVKHYGFQHLTLAYLLAALADLGDLAATTGRVILDHFGGGASMLAVPAGKSSDNSIGVTPAKLIGHRRYIDRYGRELSEVRDWNWAASPIAERQ
jgi:hypothetical protein